MHLDVERNGTMQLRVRDVLCVGIGSSVIGAGAGTSTLAEIERSVMAVAEREGGRVGVLMLSGGEPTVRRDLPEIIERMAGLPVTTLMVNTNGRRIARDDEFVELLARHQELVHVYLQFDGLRPSTYRALREEDVAYEKLKALERLSEAGVNTTLVMTVQRGVNEDEVGDVVRAGLETPSCAGLAIQPAFASGRSSGIDPGSRTTPTGVLRRLDAQTRRGAALCVAVLLGVGYFIGEKQELIKEYLYQITAGIIVLCVIIVAAYIYLRKRYFN